MILNYLRNIYNRSGVYEDAQHPTLKKQIAYIDLTSRMISVSIDMLIIAIIMMPIGDFLRKWTFFFLFKDYAISNELNLNDALVILKTSSSEEFIKYAGTAKILTYVILQFLTLITIIGAYFTIFWTKISSTPGKYIMRMKIVDAENFLNLSKTIAIKRFFFLCFTFLGIFIIPFNRKKQAIHDKLSNTVVIKM